MLKRKIGHGEREWAPFFLSLNSKVAVPFQGSENIQVVESPEQGEEFHVVVVLGSKTINYSYQPFGSLGVCKRNEEEHFGILLRKREHFSE